MKSVNQQMQRLRMSEIRISVDVKLAGFSLIYLILNGCKPFVLLLAACQDVLNHIVAKRVNLPDNHVPYIFSAFLIKHDDTSHQQLFKDAFF